MQIRRLSIRSYVNIVKHILQLPDIQGPHAYTVQRDDALLFDLTHKEGGNTKQCASLLQEVRRD